MSNPTLTVNKVVAAGTAMNLVAATVGGDFFKNSGQELLHVKNGGGASITVTVAAQQTCSQGFTHSLAVTVAAGADMLIGPLNPTIFNDQSGNVNVTYSSATSVTVGAFQLPQARF